MTGATEDVFAQAEQEADLGATYQGPLCPFVGCMDPATVTYHFPPEMGRPGRLSMSMLRVRCCPGHARLLDTRLPGGHLRQNP
jgi:hypothetical protein